MSEKIMKIDVSNCKYLEITIPGFLIQPPEEIAESTSGLKLSSLCISLDPNSLLDMDITTVFMDKEEYENQSCVLENEEIEVVESRENCAEANEHGEIIFLSSDRQWSLKMDDPESYDVNTSSARMTYVNRSVNSMTLAQGKINE